MALRNLLKSELSRQIGIGLAVLFGIELFWIAAAYPLLPKNALGWLALLVSGIVAAMWSVISVYAILWLQRRSTMRWLANAVALIFACSLGVGIFLVVGHFQEFISGSFSYFGR